MGALHTRPAPSDPPATRTAAPSRTGSPRAPGTERPAPPHPALAPSSPAPSLLPDCSSRTCRTPSPGTFLAVAPPDLAWTVLPSLRLKIDPTQCAMELMDLHPGDLERGGPTVP